MNKAATASYLFYDLKTKVTQPYTDEDLVQSLDLDKNRMKNHRPSLRNFWLSILESEAKERMYGYPKVDGYFASLTQEKGV